MNKNQSMGIWLVVGILVLALVSMLFAGPTTSTQNLSYSEFLSKVKNSEIKQVVIDNNTVIATPVNAAQRSTEHNSLYNIQEVADKDDADYTIYGYDKNFYLKRAKFQLQGTKITQNCPKG